jgi:hypothetical protein
MRDREGVPCAYGWRADGAYWVELSNSATFRIRPEEDEVAVVRARNLDREVVLDAYRTAILPIACHLSGLEALHASAVRFGTHIVGFCALSGTGKSTVAYGLSLRGHTFWTDDVLVFDTNRQPPVTCHSVPFKPHLRPDTTSFFGPSAHEAGETVMEAHSVENPPLGALVLLERAVQDEPVLTVERLSIADGLPGLLPHAFRFSVRDENQTRRTMRAYLDLLAHVPLLRARFAAGFDKLPLVLDELEHALVEATSHRA